MSRVEFRRFQELYETETSLPHAPYGPLNDAWKTDRNMNLYNCRKGMAYNAMNVLCRDSDFALLSSHSERLLLTENIPLAAIRTWKVPDRLGVTISENVSGYGDIFESLSLVMHLINEGHHPIVVLPRDVVTYERTREVLSLLEFVDIPILDYHQAHEGDEFDLVVHPSIFQKGDAYGLPSKVSIFMEEPGASNTFPLSVVWNSRVWGGVSFRIPTNYDPELGMYGATPPLFYNTSPPPRTGLGNLIQREDERELVLCYPGSNGKSDPTPIIANFAQHLDRNRELVDIIVPGNFPDTELDVRLSSSRLVYTNFLHPADLHVLIQHLSRRVPSLSAGTMSFVALLSAGVPTFYKTELWKRGNRNYLESGIRESGLNPETVEWEQTSGNGCVTLFDYSDTEKVASLCQRSQRDVECASQKIVPSLFTLYTLGISLLEEEIPSHQMSKEELQTRISAKLFDYTPSYI
jgi:hypothetical protein